MLNASDSKFFAAKQPSIQQSVNPAPCIKVGTMSKPLPGVEDGNRIPLVLDVVLYSHVGIGAWTMDNHVICMVGATIWDKSESANGNPASSILGDVNRLIVSTSWSSSLLLFESLGDE